MEYRHVLTGEYTDQPTVYKLYFGTKYYTWKGKNLKHSVTVICKDISRFQANGCPPDHLLKKVIDHITRYRCLFCRVEVLKQTDNVTELLEFENLTLQKSIEDPECLNIKFEAHVSKWMIDHGQQLPALINKKNENKPITDTLSLPEVSIHQPDHKIKPVKTFQAPTGKISLMDALANLKSKQNAS